MSILIFFNSKHLAVACVVGALLSLAFIPQFAKEVQAAKPDKSRAKNPKTAETKIPAAMPFFLTEKQSLNQPVEEVLRGLASSTDPGPIARPQNGSSNAPAESKTSETSAETAQTPSPTTSAPSEPSQSNSGTASDSNALTDVSTSNTEEKNTDNTASLPGLKMPEDTKPETPPAITANSSVSKVPNSSSSVVRALRSSALKIIRGKNPVEENVLPNVIPIEYALSHALPPASLYAFTQSLDPSTTKKANGLALLLVCVGLCCYFLAPKPSNKIFDYKQLVLSSANSKPRSHGI